MNVWKVIVLAAFGATGALAEEVDRSMEAAPEGIVSISNVSGEVTVQGWQRNEVRVVAELGSKVEELMFERDGDEIVIKVRVPRRNNGGISSDLAISVPSASSLQINTVSADIEVRGVLGEQQLESVSGDVDTEAYGADIELGSVSGDVSVQGRSETIRSRMNSVSGDVEADGLAGELDIESVSGDLAIDDGSFSRARVNTVNGDINYSARLLDGGRLDVETINGTVDIDFIGEVSARFDVETFNGAIRNCFGPEPVRTSKYAPGRELKFTEGDGAGRVTINTLNGSLRLCK